jgi:hypothetical protein
MASVDAEKATSEGMALEDAEKPFRKGMASAMP